MATLYFRGTAPRVQGVKTATPASVASTNTFTIAFGSGRSYTYTAAGTSVADVVTGLYDLITAARDAGDPLLNLLTFTDDATHLTVTGPADGEDFDFTASASGGTATLTKATVTQPSGPEWWSAGANWDTGTAPTNADTAVCESDVEILYGLATGITENAAHLIVGGRQKIGLPEFDSRGFSNLDYRPTFLEGEFSSVTIRTTGGRCKVDALSATATVRVFATGSPFDAGQKAVELRGGTEIADLEIAGGSVGVGTIRDPSATGSTLAQVTDLRVTNGPDEQADVHIGPIASCSTLHQAGGTVVSDVAITTVNKSAGELTIRGTATVGTLNNDGGLVNYDSSGTITLYRGGTRQVVEPGQAASPSRIDFSRDHRPVTVTNAVFGPEDTEFYDPGKRVTLTNAPTVNRSTAPGLKVQKVA